MKLYKEYFLEILFGFAHHIKNFIFILLFIVSLGNEFSLHSPLRRSHRSDGVSHSPPLCSTVLKPRLDLSFRKNEFRSEPFAIRWRQVLLRLEALLKFEGLLMSEANLTTFPGLRLEKHLALQEQLLPKQSLQ